MHQLQSQESKKTYIYGTRLQRLILSSIARWPVITTHKAITRYKWSHKAKHGEERPTRPYIPFTSELLYSYVILLLELTTYC